VIEANRRVSVLVGALVAAVGLTLAVVLIFLGSATRIFARTVHVSACFSDVTGLRSGAAVMVSGVAVGAVANVSLGDACGGAAKVELSVDAREAARLSADSHAKLVTMGLLGDRLVALVPGKASARLHGGEVIEGEVPPDATAVIAQAGEAFEVFTSIAHRVDDTLADTDLKGALTDILSSAQSLRRLVDRAEHGPGLLHLLIFDPALERQVRAVGPASAEAAAAVGKAEKAMGQLDHAATDLSEIVGYVKSGQGTLGGVIYDPAIYEDLRTIVGGVRRNVILRTLGRFVLKHH
jgi:phospholipid/cholesterol/gamma-HCH transport system substrate-binding protein